MDGRKLGVLGASLPDVRDRQYPARAAAEAAPVTLPMRWQSDQGPQGSCVAHAISQVVEMEAMANGVVTDVSRAFIYQESRALRGWRDQDSGTFVRDAINVMRRTGSCSENVMPYKPTDFRTRPTPDAYAEAWRNRVAEFYATPTSAHIKRALADGKGVVVCFTVYESFEGVGETGEWEEPSGSALGGHCVPIVGWDRRGGVDQFLVANSWLVRSNGRPWGKPHPWAATRPEWEGKHGFFWVPTQAVDGPAFWDRFAVLRFPLER